MAFGFLGLSLAIYAILLIDAPVQAGVFRGVPLSAVYRGAVAILAVLALSMLAASTARSFHTSVGVHALISLLIMVVFSLPGESLTILMVAGLLPLCIYERFPLSLGLSAGSAALFLLVRGLLTGFAAMSLLPAAAVGGIVALTGSLMGRHWESVIELQAYVTRLEDNVASLTRANSLTQDYARGVEEESRTAERLRLTRDIHDTIGYTMTNTIMAIEAVKMMVKSEPQKVGGYLEATRGNAEQGLAHIRQILHDFRRRQDEQDTCFMALKKLVKVFTLSTGLSVRFEFGNLGLPSLDRFGECVYHFVQEGLINAFRHGHASRVLLLFWDFGDSIRVTLDDDGAGCDGTPVPGIGLNGMIERAAGHGGTVGIERCVQGFRISMILPRGKNER